MTIMNPFPTGPQVLTRLVLEKTKVVFIATSCILGRGFIRAKQKLQKILVGVNSIGYGLVATAIS